VWLVGGAGMLGSAVTAALSRAGLDFVSTDIELDITDSRSVNGFAQDHAFTHFINCAAYTNVDGAESEPERAMAVNARGPENLARAAGVVGASLLHISTDFVFSGEASRPYREDDPCSPVNAYGRSKLEGERSLLALARTARPASCGLFIVRTSWLFGENGPSFVGTMLSLVCSQERLQVVIDQTGRPTYCTDLAAAVLDLLGLGNPAEGSTQLRALSPPSGIYHFANAGETTRYDFALGVLEAARRAGFPVRTTKIDPALTSAFPRPAARPAFSVLSTERIESALGRVPRHWRETLDDYLANARKA